MRTDIIKILIVLGFSALFFLLLTQCETEFDDENVNCADCYEEKPEESDLIIYFSDNICDTVHFIVYRGYLEESMIEWEGWATESPFHLNYTPVDFLYTVKATYLRDSISIGVVDSDELKTYLIRGVCDEDCYVIRGGEFDVKLKE